MKKTKQSPSRLCLYKRRLPLCLFWIFSLLLLNTLVVQAQGTRFSPKKLKRLTVEELMSIEVSAVSKVPEKLSEVASAIQVLTNEDIQRAASIRLPECLRLLPNLQVAQSNSSNWAITSRGFNGAPLSNNTLADKLLVMIDGRSVYTPLFGGVFWDIQQVLLEDIDRIEAVSGPGGTLWGANAVNGVINIISKSAAETQGLYASGAYGDFLNAHAAVRYGFRLDSGLYARVYGQHFNQASTNLADGTDGMDKWHQTQGGFRMDYVPEGNSTWTLQGDFYGGLAGTGILNAVDGQNLLGRWNHKLSEDSDMKLQVYADRVWRELPQDQFKEQLTTYDIDFQHRFKQGSRQQVLYGLGYRRMDDQVANSPLLQFTPANRQLDLFQGFLQDQVTLFPERLQITLGTKLLHNEYSGWEGQPSVRIAWTPGTRQTVWGAASRAVRTPARFDADETTMFITTRNREFKSEKVEAYEAGYRLRTGRNYTFSLALFYNRYQDLRSINVNDQAPPNFLFANDQGAESWGFEFSGNAVIGPRWRLRGGYTFLDKRFFNTSALVVEGSDLFEALDPNNQAFVQSILDLPKGFQLDLIGWYVDLLPASGISPKVPSYFRLNGRLAWRHSFLTVSLVGRNLLQTELQEFGSRRIPRNVFVQASIRLE